MLARSGTAIEGNIQIEENVIMARKLRGMTPIRYSMAGKWIVVPPKKPSNATSKKGGKMEMVGLYSQLINTKVRILSALLMGSESSRAPRFSSLNSVEMKFTPIITRY
jgi:hypothetical protein